MLDWFANDGIYLPMINDHVRNRFYESILRDVVKGKSCVEIGFGTGLLSMIALKHGATHIYAYEKNQHRYKLGLKIIKELRLNNKITLINEHYSSDFYNQEYVTFNEVLDQNIWGEGLWNCLPRIPTNNFLPTSYFLDIIDIPLPKEFFFKESSWFSPGIDLPTDYFNLLNGIISQDVSQEQYQEHISFLKNLDAKTFHYVLLKDNIKKINLGGYVVDTTDCSIRINNSRYQNSFDLSMIQFNINLDRNVPHLLLPRVGISANEKKLYLDSGTNWGPASGAKVVGVGIDRVKVIHDLCDGIITIHEE